MPSPPRAARVAQPLWASLMHNVCFFWRSCRLRARRLGDGTHGHGLGPGSQQGICEASEGASLHQGLPSLLDRGGVWPPNQHYSPAWANLLPDGEIFFGMLLA